MSPDVTPESNVAPYTLCLVSHSRSPPLNPPAHLKFDLRSLPNPSRSSRQNMNGKHVWLRRELLMMPAFHAELERAHYLIKEALRNYEVERRPRPEAAVVKEHGESGPAANEDTSDIDRSGEASDEDVATAPDDVILVSCFCEKGQHRSPAFVEALAGAGGWPENWDIKVIHRELGGKDNGYGLINVKHRERAGKTKRDKRSAFPPTDGDSIWEDSEWGEAPRH